MLSVVGKVYGRILIRKGSERVQVLYVRSNVALEEGEAIRIR